MLFKRLYITFLFISGISSIFIYKSYFENKVQNKVLSKNMNEIKIEELKTGYGDTAEPGKKVKINYRASLEDGFVFDSTSERNEPILFNIGAKTIVKGLNEGVIGMQVGGKRKVIVPPKLAFGKNTLGGIIPEDSFIIFEIELLDVTSSK